MQETKENKEEIELYTKQFEPTPLSTHEVWIYTL